MKHFICLLPIALCALSFQGCQPSADTPFTDIGQGFETHVLHAPWSGLENDTRFCCHSTADRFHFSFEVNDSTLTLTTPYTGEDDVKPEDRVELYFCPDKDMKEPFHCAEMDPNGHILDYEARFYRKLDFSWNFSTLQLHTAFTPTGYRVGGSIARSELQALGLDLEKGFWMGVFQADYKPNGDVVWYSLKPTDDVEADFHQPKILFPCKMTPKAERRGVVVYPTDIASVGIEEWEKRIDLSGINLIGIHAATFMEPIDSLEAFMKSQLGQQFLQMCQKKHVDVEYELHALQHLLPRQLADTHPEYFMMDADGHRDPSYNMCFSSDEAIEAMRPQLERLLAWLHPTTHRYYFWPDDVTGMTCHCPQCRDLSASEQSLLFENKMLALLRQYDPEATLAHIAYHQTLEAPLKVKASEGIFLEFAPIKRDYSKPLTTDEHKALADNLLAFPGYSHHVLEYWLDESMFSSWKRNALVEWPDNSERCASDINQYRHLGATSITTFATWLNQAYINQYGSTDDIFRHYGRSF